MPPLVLLAQPFTSGNGLGGPKKETWAPLSELVNLRPTPIWVGSRKPDPGLGQELGEKS